MPEFVSTWFWLVALAAVAANVLIYWRRAQADIAQAPPKAASYRRLLRGYAFWMTLPWLAGGGLILTGAADSLEDFFRPGATGAAVAVWHGLLVVIWGLSLRWVFYAGGAETLAAHPAFLGPAFSHPRWIKAMAALAVSSGAAAEILLWSGFWPPLASGAP